MARLTLAEKNPEIAKQWHPTKNGELTPSDVNAGSHDDAWWLLPYDDPETGKHFDFEWEAEICGRALKNIGCPFLSGRAVCSGYNDLVTCYPEVAAQWHPVKNGDITPEQVYKYDPDKYWWLLPYDDPKTGKHFDFEWKASVKARTSLKSGCPYLTGNAIWFGFNDLTTEYPEVATQWHPIKNGDLKPENFTASSGKRIWWYLPYDDQETGKHFDFEWEAEIKTRTKKGYGCPFLSGQAVWPGFNDLRSRFPMVAAEWHPTKNGNRTPENIYYKADIKVWWLLPYDDPETGKHFDFEWESLIVTRTERGYGCPYLAGQAVWLGFNDLESRFPEIALQWHPVKNGNLTPKDVYYKSDEKAWWLLSYDDPKTGKHFEFEWDAHIRDRTVRNRECPFLTSQAVWSGYNDLATRYPEIASQWHPTKNGNLKPQDVTYGADRYAWWYLPYDDPETGKHFDFEWESKIANRTSDDSECPFLSGQAVWLGFNDLASRYPGIAAQWHPVKNGDLKPQDVTYGSDKYVWWYLPYDDPETGKHFDFEWESQIGSRAIYNRGCPFLSGNAVWPGFNDLATCYPEVAAQWHPTKNGKLKPDQVYKHSGDFAWWLLPYDDPETGKHFDFEWIDKIESRTKDNVKCPYLSNRKVWPGYNDLVSCYPEIAAQWHPTKNLWSKPDKIYKHDKLKRWWLCPKCGHTWFSSVYSRTVLETGCPECRKHRVYLD